MTPDPLRYPEDEWVVEEEGVTHPRGASSRDGGKWRYDRDRHQERVIQISAIMWAEVQQEIALLKSDLAALREKVYGAPDSAGDKK